MKVHEYLLPDNLVQHLSFGDLIELSQDWVEKSFFWQNNVKKYTKKTYIEEKELLRNYAQKLKQKYWIFLNKL